MRPGSRERRSRAICGSSGLASRIAGAPGANAFDRGRGDERIGEHLGRPGGGERRGGAAPSALRAGEAAAGRSDRQHRRDAVVADDAGDLLDQGQLVGEVGAPARRGDGRDRRRPPTPSAPISSSVVDDLLAAVYSTPMMAAGQVERQLDRQPVHRSVVERAERSAVPPASSTSRSTTRAAATAERRGSTPRSIAPRRLARQLVAAGGARDRDRVEVRRLDQHVGGGVRDLGRRAAHDPGEADRAGVVGDQQVGASSVRTLPSSVSSVSPAVARRTTKPPRPASRGRSRGSAGRVRASRSW